MFKCRSLERKITKHVHVHVHQRCYSLTTVITFSYTQCSLNNNRFSISFLKIHRGGGGGGGRNMILCGGDIQGYRSEYIGKTDGYKMSLSL